MNKKNSGKLKEKINDAFLTLISIFIVINSYTVYFSEHSRFSMLFLPVLIALYVFFNLNFNNGIHVKKYSIVLGLIYLFTLLILPISWGFISVFYVYVVGILIPGFYLYILCLNRRNNIKRFVIIFVRIGFLVSLVSLFFWIFGSTIRVVKPTGYTIISWGGQLRRINNYFNIYFEPQNANIWFANFHLGVKNNSIFLEAPIACFFFISVFLLNERFNDKGKSKSIVRITLILSILSTLTTTGIVFLTLALLYFIWSIRSSKIIVKVAKICLIIIVTLFAVFFIMQLLQDKSLTGSGSVRFDKFATELKIFSSSPFFGKGFNLYTYGSSNSFAALLADGGVLLWLLYYGPLIYALIKSDFIGKLIVILFGIIFAFTVVQYTPISIILIQILMQNSIVKKDGKR